MKGNEMGYGDGWYVPSSDHRRVVEEANKLEDMLTCICRMFDGGPVYYLPNEIAFWWQDKKNEINKQLERERELAKKERDKKEALYQQLKEELGYK
jgi:hypothetical protein